MSSSSNNSKENNALPSPSMQEQNSDNDVPEQVSPSTNNTSGASASAPTSATAEPPVSSQIINSGSATADIQPGLDNDATVAAVFHAVMVLQDVYGFSGDHYFDLLLCQEIQRAMISDSHDAKLVIFLEHFGDNRVIGCLFCVNR